jgi:2,4-dienoyl-CoA reductase-like NADH-dependent reductase (Old Yellow Enzyme family)
MRPLPAATLALTGRRALPGVTMPTLFDPIRIGALDLPNRLIVAPLTRCRAHVNRTPNPIMAQYYAQRASAGLILSEATSVEPMGVGYPDTPGIWSDEQVEGWKLITKAVHDKGGRIFMQLWHVGRISDPMFLDGKQPVSAGAIAAKGRVSLVRPPKEYEAPRALETHEIPAVLEAYRRGAENALRADFDGVELHGANGYLLDQFLQDSTNKRTDEYGGSIENRAKVILGAVDAAISVWGADRVGLHLAPRCDAHDMGDSDPLATFSYVAREAGKRGLAFIFAREAQGPGLIGPQLREMFGGPFIANQGLTYETATQILADGKADAISFGVLAIANPDLIERFRLGAPLNTPVPETFYAREHKGYTDYPFLEAKAA